jgi:hypothetical protein
MSDSYLTSSAISIPALEPNEICRVRFFGWIQIDEMFDRGEFQVSSDGSSWETKAEFFYIMLGTWTEYYFDISDYTGGNIYLRFRLYVDVQEAFWIEKGYGPSYGGQYDPSVDINMAGWYIDDLAIEITETPTIQTTLTLEAWEDQYAYASCPWVHTWNGEEYVKDNDVYSTARGQTLEFTDYYTLNKPLVSENGQYLLELRETEDESSYTDLVQLMTIDHEYDVEVAADENGNVWTYSSPSQPDSAIDDNGNDVSSQISTEDDAGFHGYNDDYIVLDFSSLDITNGATLVLRVQGFQVDDDVGAGNPTLVRPWVHIQTQNADCNWVTRNEFYPRWEWSTSAYDLSDYMTTNQMVRLYVSSCHEGKYHIIDYVGLDTSPQAPTTINILSPTSAVHSVNGDVLDSISISDNNYASMTPMESIVFSFDAPDSTGDLRDFVFISEGYYVPMGTYFIYTWDGTGWAQRDGWSVEVDSDQTHNFDLSLWLPDPDGEYKVRIWQDYWYNGARIDYVGLTQDSTAGTLDTAKDLRNTANRYNTGPIPWADSTVKTVVSASDNNYMNYPLEWYNDYYYGTYGYPQRDRWLEVTWTGLIVNNPPTTNPVGITDETSPTPTISWIYNDADSDPQVNYEVEVWTGSGGTGTNVWDPSIGTGTDTSAVYAGSALIPGQTYYARVKAYDGTSWGGWSEASWTFPANQPPVADAGDDQTLEQTSYTGADVTLDGSGSYDPDGDPLTYDWTWDGGSATGVNPTLTFPLGTTTVTLTVSDGTYSDSDTVDITVQDTTPPEITQICPIDLWPPNHKYHIIQISDCVTSVTDICDPDVDIDDIIITSVSSDEPEDVTGEGDGHTLDDIVIIDYQTVNLRSERQGDGNGRVYTINFEGTDVSGNIATGSCKVWVRHDQSGDSAIDDGPSAGYTVYYP